MEEADFYGQAARGSEHPLSLMLSLEDEAVVVAFRRHTLLPLDNCIYALQVTIPRLTRSSRIAACSAVSIS